MAPSHLPTALPVAVDIVDVDLAREVTVFVESHLGWQVVLDGPDLPARLRLTDRVRAARGAVLLRRTPSAEQVSEGIRAGALEVLAWPTTPERLSATVPADRRSLAGRVTRVCGLAAGVGTTTVALAVAATHAWSGTCTWLVAEARHMTGMTSAEPAAQCPSLPGLRLAGHVRDIAGSSTPADAIVVDLGVGRQGDVVVSRPDHHLASAAPHLRGVLVVTVGRGGLHPGERDRLLLEACHVHLPWDFRVARGVLDGTLPGVFPGRWLQPLADAVRSTRVAA